MKLDIIKNAKQSFEESGGIPTHIICPYKKGDEWLTIGHERFRIIPGREMGTVLGMKIYVDEKADGFYIIDTLPYHFSDIDDDEEFEQLSGVCEDPEHQVCFTKEQYERLESGLISKQRVREAIEQEIHHVCATEFNYITTRDYLLKILKKLGLED
jgi:hypothetical protein